MTDLKSTTNTEILDQTALKIITLYEQKYFETGQIPTVQQVTNLLGLPGTTVLNYLDRPVVKETLKRRGIEAINQDGLVSIEQAYLVNLMLDTFDRRGIREKLKALKDAMGIEITFAQYNAWMKDPNFKRYLTKRAEIQFDGVAPVAKNKLVAAIEAGNLAAIEYYHEMTGIYSRSSQEMLDMRKLLAQIIDILSRHCTPEVLQTVASELELLGVGSFNSTNQRVIELPAAPVVDGVPSADFDNLQFG
jgi:hypothetical protein